MSPLKKCQFSGNTRDKVLFSFPKLLDFATKYLRKNSSLRVEIYGSLLGVRDVIARLVKIWFSLSTILNNPFRLFAFPFWNDTQQVRESNESNQSSSLSTTTTTHFCTTLQWK